MYGCRSKFQRLQFTERHMTSDNNNKPIQKALQTESNTSEEKEKNLRTVKREMTAPIANRNPKKFYKRKKKWHTIN